MAGIFVVEVGNDHSVSLPEVALPSDTIINPENQVLFLGEGNFTFSFAFACLRGTWQNIYATTYNDELPSFEESQVETIRNIISNLHFSPNEPALEYIQSVSNFRSPEFQWQSGIDATNIPSGLITPVIWFQCPWVTKWKRTSDLLRSFFRHVGNQQEKGHIIILGIISKAPYCESYDLESLITGTEYYDFIGADNQFIKNILNRGYRHQGVRDIHRVIYHTHLSLLFQHK